MTKQNWSPVTLNEKYAMNLQELFKQRKEEMDACDRIFSATESGNRAMSEHERRELDSHQRTIADLDTKIKTKSANNTLMPGSHLLGGGDPAVNRGSLRTRVPDFQPDVEAWEGLLSYFESNGKNIPPALQRHQANDGIGGFPAMGIINVKRPSILGASYEGGSTSGQPIVPSMVEQQIVALAPPEISVRKLSMVIPTAMDLKIPRKTAEGTAAMKAESGGSNNAFGGSDPTLEQFTLTANMIGHIADASWELLQDVNIFQSFLTQDILLSIAILEEQKFLSGSGSGEPEGLLGNIGAGVSGVTVGSDTYADELLQATFDVQGTLPGAYHANASWLMSRATSVVLRKAQSSANLFWPLWTRVGSQDYLHGYPVEYATNMPAIAAGNTPVVFGDFKSGYIIGDRGGSGVNIKILDQPKASLGILEVLGYRRTDGRVRRSEALQGITLHT